MFESLGWLPTFPLLGFLTLFLSGGGLPKKLVAVIGAGSIGLAFCAAVCGFSADYQWRCSSHRSRGLHVDGCRFI